jgi:hypothetical protein
MALIFMVVAISVFNVVAARWLPPYKGGGIDYLRAAWSAGVGAVAAVLGAGFGNWMDASSPAPIQQVPSRRRRGSGSGIPVMVLAFMIIGIAFFNTIAHRWFPPPADGGLNIPRLAWSGVVGAFSAVVGFLVSINMSPPGRE